MMCTDELSMPRNVCHAMYATQCMHENCRPQLAIRVKQDFHEPSAIASKMHLNAFRGLTFA